MSTRTKRGSQIRLRFAGTPSKPRGRSTDAVTEPTTRSPEPRSELVDGQTSVTEQFLARTAQYMVPQMPSINLRHTDNATMSLVLGWTRRLPKQARMATLPHELEGYFTLRLSCSSHSEMTHRAGHGVVKGFGIGGRVEEHGDGRTIPSSKLASGRGSPSNSSRAQHEGHVDESNHKSNYAQRDRWKALARCGAKILGL